MSFRSTLEYINTQSEICQLLFSHFQKLFFVIQHAVAIAFKVRVRDLLTEFLTDTFIFLRPLQAAGAVSASALEPLLNGGNHFFIFIQSDGHMQHFLSN